MKLRTMSVAVVCAAVALAGVPACTATTGGERFPFHAYAAGPERDDAAALRFRNDYGYEIVLEKAVFTFGPVYLNTALPNSGNAYDGATGWLRRGCAPLRVRDALAHSGTVGDGRVVGEILSQITVDLTKSAPLEFPTLGSAVNDPVKTLDVLFWPPPGVAPESLKTPAPVLSVAGRATAEGVDVSFRGELVLDDTWLGNTTPGSPGNQGILDIRTASGIRTEFTPSNGGELLVRIDPRGLFDGCDFSTLGDNPTDPADATRKLLVQSKTANRGTDQVMRNLYQNVRQSTGTYDIRWRKP